MRRRAATSGEQLPQPAPGDEACCRGCMPPAPRGRSTPQHARHARGAKACAADARRRPPPEWGRFPGTATSARAGAALRRASARRRPRKCTGGRQPPGNGSQLGRLPRVGVLASVPAYSSHGVPQPVVRLGDRMMALWAKQYDGIVARLGIVGDQHDGPEPLRAIRQSCVDPLEHVAGFAGLPGLFCRQPSEAARSSRTLLHREDPLPALRLLGHLTSRVSGYSLHSRPSSSRPPALGVRPPHCLWKNATPLEMHRSRISRTHTTRSGIGISFPCLLSTSARSVDPPDSPPAARTLERGLQPKKPRSPGAVS